MGIVWDASDLCIRDGSIMCLFQPLCCTLNLCRENSFCISWRNTSKICQDLWPCCIVCPSICNEWWICKNPWPTDGVFFKWSKCWQDKPAKRWNEPGEYWPLPIFGFYFFCWLRFFCKESFRCMFGFRISLHSQFDMCFSLNGHVQLFLAVKCII